MLRSAIIVLLACLFIVSCAGAPAPKPADDQAASKAPGDSAFKDRAKALIQGETAAPPASNASSSSATSATADVPPPAPGVLSPEEEAYLNNYLARLNYMVYYDDKAGIAPQYAKIAVSQANRYLIEKLGLSVIDFDQVEKNKKDQLSAYQAETGGSIDIIQFIAQKNNADVYVELSFAASSRTANGKSYATAQGTMKIFDTSTSQLIGSVAFQSPEVMSTSSEGNATGSAISASVWTAMPRVTDQSKALIKNSLSRGVRYEVVIQNTPDSKVISTLRRSLAKDVREVEQVSYSPSETKLFLYSFKSRDKIEDAMYDAADRSGFKDMYLVFSRGKAFTFNSGN